MGDEKKIYVVIPAYNAAKTIANIFDRIPKSFFPKATFLIVNDGSTDNTAEVAKKIQKSYPNVEIIIHEVNKGYGQTQKTGYNEALRQGADMTVLLHSDGQYAPELIEKICQPILEGKVDVAMGSRMLGGGALKGGMPRYKYYGNKFLTMIENLAYGMHVSEFHSGYMAYSRKTLETVPFNDVTDTFHFDGEMLLRAHKKGLKIAEISIPTRYAEEKSHLNPITYGLNVLKIVFRNFMGKYD